MRKLLIAAVLVGAASIVGHMHASMQTYYPVVKFEAPDGMTYTAVADAMADRPACGEASKRLLTPMRALCPDCEIVLARCERELDGVEMALNVDGPAPVYVVTMDGLRVGITGDDAKARQTCSAIAIDIVQRGVPTAACRYPSLSKALAVDQNL